MSEASAESGRNKGDEEPTAEDVSEEPPIGTEDEEQEDASAHEKEEAKSKEEEPAGDVSKQPVETEERSGEKEDA